MLATDESTDEATVDVNLADATSEKPVPTLTVTTARGAEAGHGTRSTRRARGCRVGGREINREVPVTTRKFRRKRIATRRARSRPA